MRKKKPAKQKMRKVREKKQAKKRQAAELMKQIRVFPGIYLHKTAAKIFQIWMRILLKAR